MKRHLYFVGGWTALGLGAIGAVLPLLPTVPFIILAAFCFARSSRKLEIWLVEHPQFGPHITAWREKGAISKKGKRAALLTYVISMLVAVIFTPWPWVLIAVAAILISGTWLMTRPES
ncbi:YbaN family protein [Sphingopyxis yananensis]|uniref:YbaN family protein n=1 Tax=Sphingopyxis yananensis TaxID=2886687 RepID=UPI001D10F67C|nr:YbaN family protein [Sphingopyxis yananensis]MCC2603388.1 YbaN family protein [Sphingopyxis yananensis]